MQNRRNEVKVARTNGAQTFPAEFKTEIDMSASLLPLARATWFWNVNKNNLEKKCKITIDE